MGADFDLLLLLIERDVPVLSVGLPYIVRFIRPRRIHMVASAACLARVRAEGLHLAAGPETILVDEDVAVPGLDLGSVRSLIEKRGGDPRRTGWYFKQILILAWAIRPGCPDFYLTWDTDTIPVRHMSFFDEAGRAFLTMKDEHHRPYFETLRRLIGEGKVTERSFIAEHMLFEREIVRSLLRRIAEAENPEAAAIAERIIGAVSETDLPGSGFSEYETYGSFAFMTARDRIHLRDLPSSRHGTGLFGRSPSAANLFALSHPYAWASFEAWSARSLRSRAARAARRLLGLAWTAAAVAADPRGYQAYRRDIAAARAIGGGQT